jgi:hypothetical protein
MFLAEPTIEDLINTCGTDQNTLKILDIPELDSDELKVLFYVHDKFYHFFADTLPFLLKLYNLDPKIRFVLYIKKSEHINSEPFLEVLFEVLEHLDAKWTVLESVYEDQFFPVCKIRNFIQTDERVFNLHGAISLKDTARGVELLKSKYLSELEVKAPWRKIYIPIQTSSDFGDVYAEGGSYIDDARMYDPEKLEQYFVDSGYDVVVPERDFSSIAEQMKFMSEVKVLASVSSSSLTNAIFMAPGGVVIEVAAEIVVPNVVGTDGRVRTKQEIPLEFYKLSFGMGHTHIMVPTNRDANVAILKLDSLRREQEF